MFTRACPQGPADATDLAAAEPRRCRLAGLDLCAIVRKSMKGLSQCRPHTIQGFA
jgi:hypothetical protein